VEKKRKKLLDIGAGDGSITRNFESFVEQIYYKEPSHSFQKILHKRGYKWHLENKENTYDIITLFNVLDVCDNPHDMIHWAIQHLKKNGEIIISLPFPIQARSWDNKKIYKTNLLTQDNKISFEKAVSNFYRDFIEKNELTVHYFTRLPYIVSLPETQETTIYDNGLFVCKMA
jgi:SAM-dependent methyltransferase